MRGQLYILALLITILLSAPGGSANGSDRWNTPFAITKASDGVDDSILTIGEVLYLVATSNPLLSSFALRLEAAQGRIVQAGVRPNPELGAEIEEVGWDAPGFDESAMSVSLSQEFEIFGQRGARRKVAEATSKMTKFESEVAAFDLYLETRVRYYRLAHVQEQSHLSDISIELAESTVATIRERIDKGAALESELLLARLELQRAKLAGADMALDIETARIELASLWGGDPSSLTVVMSMKPDFEGILGRISELNTDSTRELMAIDNHRVQLSAEQQLTACEAKPNLTLSGGYKRLAADGSNSFALGLSLPLPFSNQNRGTLRSLDAEIQQLDFERKQAQLESGAVAASGVARLKQLIVHHDALNDELLPTADEAYRTMQTLYQSGRLPYTSLLEANRALVELRFEYNDILLTLREQIITLERLGGVILQADEDSDND